MTDRDALLSAVLNEPGDDTARLVLADFLREQRDPADVALGRFLWAGVVTSSYQSAGGIDDAELYTAHAELSAVVSDGWPARWLESLGLGPSPLSATDWGWDHTADRVTVRAGRVVAEFERGVLARLTVSLREWYEVARAALAAWPVEGVMFTDVPGLALWIDRPDEGPGGWRVAVAMTVQEFSARRGWLQSFFGPERARLPRPAPAVRRTAYAVLPDRPALVARIRGLSAELVASLRDQVGGQWPALLPPGERIG
jgi:uncharacterized protein (TIGR02996 family)